MITGKIDIALITHSGFVSLTRSFSLARSNDAGTIKLVSSRETDLSAMFVNNLCQSIFVGENNFVLVILIRIRKVNEGQKTYAVA